MARGADGSFRRATEIDASTSDEIDAGWDEAPTQVTLPPTSGARKVSGVHALSTSLPPVVSAPRPTPSGRVPRAMSAPSSWMDRATLLQQQLRIGERPSLGIFTKPALLRHEPAPARPAREEPALVRDESALVRDESTLVREESTLVREEPTLVREEPTLVREEPTLEFSNAYLEDASSGIVERRLDARSPDVGAEVAEQVRDDELFTEESGPEWREPLRAADATSRTSELDVPDFRRHQVSPAMVVAAMAAAAMLIVASVLRLQFPSHHEGGGLEPPQQRTPQPLATASPEPAPLAVMSANAAPRIATVPPATSAGASPENGSNAVVVTVKVMPTAAVIFRAGVRLGVGEIQVRVEHDAKQRLTALHEGYVPHHFTLDGSRDSVNVRLKPAPRPRAAATLVSDSPFESVHDESNDAAPRPAAPAPAPESTPLAAPSPPATERETSPE